MPALPFFQQAQPAHIHAGKMLALIYTVCVRMGFLSANEYAVYAEMMWQIQPRVPPEPIHNPGVMISQKIARKIFPL
jgi:hypothetical protein